MIFFFDSLCREEDVSDDFIKKVALYYQANCKAENWHNMIVYLIAVYRLFEILLIKEK